MEFTCPECKALVRKTDDDPIGCPCCGFKKVTKIAVGPFQPVTPTPPSPFKKIDPLTPFKKLTPWPSIPNPFEDWIAPYRKTKWWKQADEMRKMMEEMDKWQGPKLCEYCGLPYNGDFGMGQCPGMHVYWTTTSNTLIYKPDPNLTTTHTIVLDDKPSS